MRQPLFSRVLLTATVIVLAGALSACGGRGGRVKEVEKVDIDRIVLPQEPLRIRTLWKKQTGGGDATYLDVATDGGLVLVVGADGRFQAIDGASGDTVWRHDLKVRITGGAGSGDGLALAVDEEGMVYALDAHDGSLRWSARVLAEVLAPPNAGQGVTVVRTADGRVIGLSSDDGERRWVFRKPEQGLTVRGSAPPVISGGVVYNAFAGGEVTANEIAGGKLLWETNLVFPSGGNEIERLSDIDSRPLLTRKYLYAGSAYRSELAALDLANPGAPLWSAAIGSGYELAVDGERLYVVDGEGVAHAVHRLSGDILWSQPQLRGELSSAPVILGRHLLIGGASGALYLLDTADGSIQGRRRGGAAPLALRSFGGARAYLLGRDGRLSALAIDDS